MKIEIRYWTYKNFVLNTTVMKVNSFPVQKCSYTFCKSEKSVASLGQIPLNDPTELLLFPSYTLHDLNTTVHFVEAIIF